MIQPHTIMQGDLQDVQPTPPTEYPVNSASHLDAMVVPSTETREPIDRTANPVAGASAEGADSRENRLPFWQRFLLRMFVYFSIYVISLGPMYWQWWEGKYMNGSKLVAAFYEPLFLVSGWIPPLGWFVNSYVHLWVFDLQLWMV